MTITSQALSGDELTRFISKLQNAKLDGTEAELNRQLAEIVRSVVAGRDDKDTIKRALADALRAAFPDIQGL
jgi:hypothetical protein